MERSYRETVKAWLDTLEEFWQTFHDEVETLKACRGDDVEVFRSDDCETREELYTDMLERRKQGLLTEEESARLDVIRELRKSHWDEFRAFVDVPYKVLMRL